MFQWDSPALFFCKILTSSNLSTILYFPTLLFFYVDSCLNKKILLHFSQLMLTCPPFCYHNLFLALLQLHLVGMDVISVSTSSSYTERAKTAKERNSVNVRSRIRVILFISFFKIRKRCLWSHQFSFPPYFLSMFWPKKNKKKHMLNHWITHK